MRLKPKHLIIADPWETLDHPRDSSIYLSQVGKEEFGLDFFWTTPEQIIYTDESLHAVTLAGETLALSSFQCIHWRTDPPVDLKTFRLWQLLGSRQEAEGLNIVNPPHALLTWNEKFSALRFKKWALPSVVAYSVEQFRDFHRELTARGARVIAKPVGDAASRGVRLLKSEWSVARDQIHELQTQSGPWVMLQEFDENLINYGETRVFVLNGKVFAALLKLPDREHPIINFDVPEEPQPQLKVVSLNSVQRMRSISIARTLHKNGVMLATIDYIGSRILEVNVTSPGLIRWLDEHFLKDKKLAQAYWEILCRKK